MSTTDNQILDIYQMSLDTGESSDRIRASLYELHRGHVYLVTDAKKITTVREALNAHANLEWFFKNHRSAHSASEAGQLLQSVKDRWYELSLKGILEADSRKKVLEALKESPKDILHRPAVAAKVSQFYKLVRAGR